MAGELRRVWRHFTADIKEKEILEVVSVAVIGLILYAGLFLAIGQPFLPPAGPAWAIILIWAVSGGFGYLADKVGLPGPLGMIASGILLRNVNGGAAIAGLQASWSKQIRAAALAIIFLRSGLEIDLDIFKKVGPIALRLLFIPGIAEALFDGGMMVALFGMPVLFAFGVGFILKAVGPALVIQAMFETQQRRLGAAKGIPATIVAAASFDDAVAITGYTIFINLAVHGEGNDKVWQIMHGPLSIVLGICSGLVAALICSCTRLWNNSLKRTTTMFIVALVCKYFYDHFDFTSAGAVSALVQGLAAKSLWRRGWPKAVAGESGAHVVRVVEGQARTIWRIILMPALFGLTGTGLNFAVVPTSIIPKACAVILAGLAVRMPCTFLVTGQCCGLGGTTQRLSLRERAFFAFAWSPKATVQAALANAPSDLVNAAYPDKTSEVYQQYHAWGEDAFVVAVLCIVLCAFIGTLLIRFTAPWLLEAAEDDHPSTGLVTGPSSHEAALRQASAQSASPSGAASPSGPSQAGPQLAKISPEEETRGPGSGAVGPGGAVGPEGLVSGGWAAGPDRDAEGMRSHYALLGVYLDSIEEVGEEIKSSQGAAPAGEAAAGAAQRSSMPALTDRLMSSIHQMRNKLVEGGRPEVPREVESADQFMRASATLRQRSTRLTQTEMTDRSTRSGPVSMV